MPSWLATVITVLAIQTALLGLAMMAYLFGLADPTARQRALTQRLLGAVLFVAGVLRGALQVV